MGNETVNAAPSPPLRPLVEEPAPAPPARDRVTTFPAQLAMEGCSTYAIPTARVVGDAVAVSVADTYTRVAAGVAVMAGVAVQLDVPVFDLNGVHVEQSGAKLKTTLSMFCVPPAAVPIGLPASFTQRLATLSAPAPRGVEPAVVLPVDRYSAPKPKDVAPPVGRKLAAVTYVPVGPDTEYDSEYPCGAVAAPRTTAEKVTPE